MKNETLPRLSFVHRLARPITGAGLVLAIAVGFWAAGAGSGFGADGQKGVDALDPRRMAAQCRAKERKVRDALPSLRKLVQEHERWKKRWSSQVKREQFYTKSINERLRISERRRKKWRSLQEKCRRASNGTMDANRFEICRQYKLHDALIAADDKFISDMGNRLYEANESIADARRKLDEITNRIKETMQLPPTFGVTDLSTEAIASIEADLHKLANRCRTLERLAKLTEELIRPGPEQEKAEETPPPERKTDVKDNEARQSGETSTADRTPGNPEAGPKDKRAAEMGEQAPDPEAGARADIADARRYYNEARAFDVEDKKARAAASYRVAMSLLAEAKEKSRSQERRRKIDKILANLSKRVAELPGGAAAGGKQADGTPAERWQREAGNAECAAKYQGAIMLKPRTGADGFWCVCRKGYGWNKSRTACVKAPSRKQAGQAACTGRYRNSIYAGMKNGMAQCKCPRGRRFNAARTACVRVPRAQTSRRQQELERRRAQAAYTLGVLIGQALRSGGHATPSRTRRPSASHAQPRRTPPGSSWRDRFGKRKRMTPQDYQRYR